MLQKYSQAFEKINKYRNVVNVKMEVFLEKRRRDDGVSYLEKGDKQNIFSGIDFWVKSPKEKMFVKDIHICNSWTNFG